MYKNKYLKEKKLFDKVVDNLISLAFIRTNFYNMIYKNWYQQLKRIENSVEEKLIRTIKFFLI